MLSDLASRHIRRYIYKLSVTCALPFQVCVAFRTGASCNTMDQLCGSQACTYAIFNLNTERDKCCPVRNWYEDPSAL